MPIIPEPELLEPLKLLSVREARVIAKRPLYILDNMITVARYDVWRCKDERLGRRKIVQAYRIVAILVNARVTRKRDY